jgi:hypothetical protein
MTDQNYTHISYLLDHSGSMHAIWADATGGYTQFVQTQKAVPGKATFSFSVFDDEYTPIQEFANLQAIKDEFPGYVFPGGSTALIDAAVRMITETGAKLASLPEDERPGKVVFVIYTDGQENASRENSRQQLQELITHQTDVYGWDFIFLASNIDAAAAAASYGINYDTSADVHSNNLQYANHLTSAKLASYRTTGHKSDLTYSAAEVTALAQDPNDTGGNGPVS